MFAWEETTKIFAKAIASKNSNDTGLSLWSFPGGSDGNLPTMKETWVQSLGQKDLLEEEMATHSSTLRLP